MADAPGPDGADGAPTTGGEGYKEEAPERGDALYEPLLPSYQVEPYGQYFMHQSARSDSVTLSYGPSDL